MRAGGQVSRQLRPATHYYCRTPPLLAAHEKRPLIHHHHHHHNHHNSLLVAFSPGGSPGGRRQLHVHIQPLVEASVHATQELITQLHVVSHTPWFVTLPLVALGVNLLFRLPFAVYGQRIAQRRAALVPLLRAWNVAHVQQLAQEAVPLRRRSAELVARHLATTRRLYAERGLQTWRLFGNLLSLPPWLVVVETIRRMCGAPVGLLGLIFRGKEAGAGAASSASPGVGQGPPEVHAVTDAASASGAPASPELGVSTDTLDTLSSYFDPSLSTGGCLWFTDLTQADPYHVLPFALSAILIANVLPRTATGLRDLFSASPSAGDGKQPQASALVSQSAMMRGLQRALLIMAATVGPVTMNFPAAVHVYWISSACTSFLIVRGVRLFMPVPKSTIEPCKGVDTPFIRPPKPSPAAPLPPSPSPPRKASTKGRASRGA